MIDTLLIAIVLLVLILFFGLRFWRVAIQLKRGSRRGAQDVSYKVDFFSFLSSLFYFLLFVVILHPAHSRAVLNNLLSVYIYI